MPGLLDPPQTWMLDDDLFRRFCALIHDATGLHFGETSRYFVERRLESRMLALGGMSPGEYIQFLEYDPERAQEWDQLIAVITTNETYFMREERQLRCFQQDILPLLLEARGKQKIRVWSAGCSSGEEAYTLAILVREAQRCPEDQVEIYATDINTRVLAKAKNGVYTESSFRAVDAAFRQRWFREVEPGKFQIAPDIQRRVTFARFNLFDAERYSLLSPFDVIFCRNVIIYFDLEAKVRVVDRFNEKLRAGGYLLLGHSESLISVTDKFTLVHLPNDLVYMKAAP